MNSVSKPVWNGLPDQGMEFERTARALVKYASGHRRWVFVRIPRYSAMALEPSRCRLPAAASKSPKVHHDDVEPIDLARLRSAIGDDDDEFAASYCRTYVTNH